MNSRSDVGIIPSAKRGKEMDTLRLVKGASATNFPLGNGNQEHSPRVGSSDATTVLGVGSNDHKYFCGEGM